MVPAGKSLPPPPAPESPGIAQDAEPNSTWKNGTPLLKCGFQDEVSAHAPGQIGFRRIPKKKYTAISWDRFEAPPPHQSATICASAGGGGQVICRGIGPRLPPITARCGRAWARSVVPFGSLGFSVAGVRGPAKGSVPRPLRPPPGQRLGAAPARPAAVCGARPVRPGTGPPGGHTVCHGLRHTHQFF